MRKLPFIVCPEPERAVEMWGQHVKEFNFLARRAKHIVIGKRRTGSKGSGWENRNGEERPYRAAYTEWSIYPEHGQARPRQRAGPGEKRTPKGQRIQGQGKGKGAGSGQRWLAHGFKRLRGQADYHEGCRRGGPESQVGNPHFLLADDATASRRGRSPWTDDATSSRKATCLPDEAAASRKAIRFPLQFSHFCGQIRKINQARYLMNILWWTFCDVKKNQCGVFFNPRV